MADGTMSSEEFSSLTGLTDKRHRQLAKEGWFPPPEDGRWKTAPCIRGMFKYYRGSAERNERKTNIELKNQLLQIAVKAKLHEYIPTTEVRQFMAKMIVGAKTRALAMPSAMAPKVALMSDAVAIEEMLHAAVRDLLVEMESGTWCERKSGDHVNGVRSRKAIQAPRVVGISSAVTTACEKSSFGQYQANTDPQGSAG
ncbi:MAG: hypothetical protein JNK85_22505 [Verrucomicrobiales bacterium]|nr:hypothetical protein [Verrucomicrobiales bacterium]